MSIYVSSMRYHKDFWLRMSEMYEIDAFWLNVDLNRDTAKFHKWYIEKNNESIDSCDAFLVYAEKGDHLSETMFDLGFIWDTECPIIAVGMRDTPYGKSGRMEHYDTVSDALNAARKYVARNAISASLEEADTDPIERPGVSGMYDEEWPDERPY